MGFLNKNNNHLNKFYYFFIKRDQGFAQVPVFQVYHFQGMQFLYRPYTTAQTFSYWLRVMPRF